MKKTLIYNAEVFTVNKNDDIVDAVVFEGNRILFAGSVNEAEKYCDDATERIDAGGKTVMPAFTETHIHIASRIVFTRGLDFSKRSGINNIGDMKKRIQDRIAEAGKDAWVIGHGLTFEDLEEKRWPTRWELDEVSRETPVAITHSSAHTGLYNTRALELCHLLDGKIAYPTEHVIKDANGEATGVLKESAHFMMSEEVGRYNPLTEEMVQDCILDTVKMMNEAGITSANDAGGTGTMNINALQKLCKAGKLTCRMFPMLFSLRGLDDNLDFVKANMRTGFITGLGDDYMRIGPLKIMVDGSGASGTCATRQPMSHNGLIMPPSMTQEQIDDIVIRAHKCGYQVTAHCIGDKGVEMILNAYEKAQKEYPRKDCRHRIEHCMIAEPDLLERICDLGVIPAFNPAFINLWGSSFNKYYQGSRNDYLIAMKSAMDMGIICTSASDWECIPDIRPLQGIASAVDRTIYATGEKVAEKQKLTLAQAVRSYTYNSAYANFNENILGSLESGKLADIIILNGTLTKTDTRDMADMGIYRTYFDGREVYTK